MSYFISLDFAIVSDMHGSSRGNAKWYIDKPTNYRSTDLPIYRPLYRSHYHMT